MDAPSLDQVFAWFDRDGNGYIDVPEFIEGIRCVQCYALHSCVCVDKHICTYVLGLSLSLTHAHTHTVGA